MSERNAVREVNALTIMPLPVRIPNSWYSALPKALPLVRQALDQPRHCFPEEIVQLFLKKWSKILIRNDGTFVWLRLGGVACYQVIPDFVRKLRELIESNDREITEKGGTQAVIHHWRLCIDDFKALDDEDLLKARAELLLLLCPEIWHEGLSKSWGVAAERAHVNFGKIRPVIRNWISKYESRFNLDEPFGGILSRERYQPASGTVI